MKTLESISKDFSEIVSTAGNLVVHIEGARSFSGLRWLEPGLVITSASFVAADQPHHRHWPRRREAVALTVVDADGTEHAAQLLGVDTRIDIAVLKVDGLAAAPKGSFSQQAAPAATGELVLSLGRPGKVTRAALGLVSAVSAEPWRTPAGGKLAYYLEVDGNLPEGFSGGPLVSSQGLVLGMNTIAMPRGTGMTVPVADIVAAVTRISQGSVWQRLYLGVNTVPVPTPAGLMVTEVEAGSPADKAGVLAGDILLALGGTALTHYGDLVQALELDGPATKEPQSRILKFSRAGQTEEVMVELAVKQ